MARPEKEKELKHAHRIYLRLTDTEFEIVTEYARNTNLSLAEYARQQINLFRYFFYLREIK